ncbi:hypothetical protein L249_1076 [Ophiocordyceps polyrhachis-furcata BCC 54312]|uniref:Major facilitator superfamily (MFS) profile domain-containing protein n=1 Tax=Ophiocordyceps polyrhachis-furcata BCC 54312 TaxID=1330021 RepID=A0A367LC47_9HYPO|nr:hypothetical protein L249_1076 [Ophiocordyceps polyrhachis-furcata BCC 54312]
MPRPARDPPREGQPTSRPISAISPSWRLSTIGYDELSVFRPLEVTHVTALDFIFPQRPASWRQSVVSNTEHSTRFPLRASIVPPAKVQEPGSRTTSSFVESPSALSIASALEVIPPYAQSTSSGHVDYGAQQSEYPSGFKLWIMIAALVSSIFLIALDMASRGAIADLPQTIVATAVPAITDEFHGLQDVAWYGAIFFMTAGGFQSTWGKTYKSFPLKMGFLTAIFIFEVGSLICGVAPSSSVFIVGRAIAGVGAAGVGSGSYTLVAFIAEPKKRAAYTGLLGAIFGIGSVLGPLLGGVFSSRSTWRWCFYINLPIGVLPVLTIVPLKEKLLQMDPLGTCLLMGAIITYLMAVHYGGQIYPWSSSLVVGLLVGSCLLSIAFCVCEYWQGDRAIVIPRLFKQRRIGLSAIYSILQSGAFFSMIYYLPLYFQAIRGSDAVVSGVQNLPFILAAMLGALGAGIFISSTGMATLVMVGGAAIGTLGCGLCYLFDMNTSTGTWIGFQIIAGVSLGGALQIPVIVGQVSVEPEDLSSATSMMLCFQTLGGAIWTSAAQSAFVNRMIIAVPTLAPGVDPMRVVATGAGQLRTVFRAHQLVGVIAAYLDGIRTAFILSCTAVGAACVLGLFLPWKRLDVVAVRENSGGA